VAKEKWVVDNRSTDGEVTLNFLNKKRNCIASITLYDEGLIEYNGEHTVAIEQIGYNEEIVVEQLTIHKPK
jgi:hypothetical protein